MACGRAHTFTTTFTGLNLLPDPIPTLQRESTAEQLVRSYLQSAIIQWAEGELTGNPCPGECPLLIRELDVGPDNILVTKVPGAKVICDNGDQATEWKFSLSCKVTLTLFCEFEVV